MAASAPSPLRFPEEYYLQFDPFEGDRDVDIRCRTVKLKRARKVHPCLFGQGSHGDGHTIKAGDMYRDESALVDGDFWGRYKVCVGCMDKWLTEIGLGSDDDDEQDEGSAA